jgi:hypothetical protein
VVATDIGDARRIVGGLGEVVPPRNPDALAAGWARLRQRLMQEPELRSDVRTSIITNYGVARMVGRTEHVLALLCENRPASEIVRAVA